MNDYTYFVLNGLLEEFNNQQLVSIFSTADDLANIHGAYDPSYVVVVTNFPFLY